MKTKSALIIFLATLIVTSTLSQTRIVGASSTTYISVSPPIRDKRGLVEPGGTFSINITISNVQKLFGYQFTLYYNTTILNATDAVSYSPFMRSWVLMLNDTAGFVTMAYSFEKMGETEGLTTVPPVRVAKIDFTVVGLGTTDLRFDADPSVTVLSNIYGDPIAYDNPVLPLAKADGKFSNTQEIGVHDIVVTDLTVSPITLKPGDVVSIDAKVANKGEFNETFAVLAKYNETQIQTPKTVTNLAPEGSATVSFSWNTTGVAEAAYIVSVSANVAGESNPQDNTRSETVKISGAGGGFDFNLLYVAAIVVIVIVVVIVVYALRARKP